MELEPGRIVERYRVEELLGEGGMASVYRVRHTTLDTLHALKVLTLTHRSIRERLITEGRVQATLQHPHAVAVQDVFEVDGSPCLLMEFVDGPDLGELIARPDYDPADAERIFREIASAVGEAHRRGLVHRDLKPANVLMARVQDTWVAKVADFGLAKAVLDGASGTSDHGTRTGVTMGTPAYMAPEQIRDAKNVDQRADIFSLGCILYELVTRQQAFLGADIVELFTAITEGRYVPVQDRVPACPPHLVRVIEACLQVDPADRPPSCEAIFDLLDGSGPTERSAALPAPSQPAGRPPDPITLTTETLAKALPARRGLLAAVLALPLAVLVLGGGAAALAVGGVLLWIATSAGSIEEEDPADALPCGGQAGEVVGWALGGQHPFFNRPRGSVWTLSGEVRVVTEPPGEENSYTPSTEVVCTLPPRTQVHVVEDPVRVRRHGVWVPIVADAITLPEPPPAEDPEVHRREATDGPRE